MSPKSVSRRAFLGTAGAGALATTVALGADALALPPAAGASTPSGADAAVPFEGVHQAGIVTPVQDRLMFASFDVITDDRDDLAQLLEDWTSASRRMVKGQLIGTDNDDLDAPPDDTGEAEGLGPESLTLTFGFGASLFDRPGDPFGIAGRARND